ncbi:MAG: hypothetical protein WAJ86_17575 [Candidatus Acidiferrales bacterium]
MSLLLIGMTLVSVYHHHSADASEANCSICHLSHQPIDRPLAVDSQPTMALLAAAPEPRDTGLASAPVIRRLPARAPPSA